MTFSLYWALICRKDKVTMFYYFLYIMENILDYEEAKLQKSFYVVDHWVVDYKNFYELIKDTKVASTVWLCALKRVGKCNPLAYYVNNVVSIAWSPKRVGSFACDISYWITERTKQDLSELIWFIVNEMWYFDYVDENDNYIEVSDEVAKRKIELFMNRLEMWFWCIMEDGRRLPRGRWIDTPTETTS